MSRFLRTKGLNNGWAVDDAYMKPCISLLLWVFVLFESSTISYSLIFSSLSSLSPPITPHYFLGDSLAFHCRLPASEWAHAGKSELHSHHLSRHRSLQGSQGVTSGSSPPIFLSPASDLPSTPQQASSLPA